MATGSPRASWNDKNSDKTKSNFSENISTISLSYADKRSEHEILKTEAVDTQVLWRGVGQTEDQTVNSLYYGDNLPILASMLQDSTIKGNVRMVYIDPPFATNSIFQSRSQGDAYCDLLVGANYIEFLRERLILLRELLADDGSIYVHLDENMAFHIKLIMDEIFGNKNFRNWITRKKCNPKNYTRKTYGNVSDFVLFYTKTDTYVWNRPVEAWTDEHALKEYQYIDQETGRRYKKVPVHAPGVRNGETGMPWKGKLPPPGKHWQYPPKALDEMDARGEIYWSANNNPRRKIYLDQSSGIPVQDIWLDFRDAHNQNIKVTGYPTEKNPDLLSRIIQASSNPGDLVLDCFSGSGTTLAISSNLKRRWIGIDNSVEAIVTTLNRFTQGTKPMGDFVLKQEKQTLENTAQALNLWDTLEEAKENNNMTTEKKFLAIKDFSLYTTEKYSEILAIAIEEQTEQQKVESRANVSEL